MQVAKEQLEGNKVELKVEIEKEKVNEALEKAYRKVVKKIQVPGFRKGRVPRRVLEARFGKEVLHQDAFDILIPEAYQQAVQAAEIEPIAQPVVNDFYIAENEPATFTAVVEVKPEVKLGDYTGLGIEKEEVQVAEEDIEKRLQRLQDQHSQLETTERETIEEGDFAIIDFEGYLDGEKFAGGSAEEYTLEIGSGTFIPGFEEQLIGRKVGEEVEVKVTFPEDYHSEKLAGKDAVFKVKIKEIKVKKLPELNDDFAKEVSEFNTLAELKEDIRSHLQEQAEERAKFDFQDKLIEKVTENATVEVPDTLIENELEMMYHNLAYTLSMQGINVETYFQQINSTKEDWKEKNRETAINRAKSNLVLEAIAKKEGIEVTDEEINNKIEEMAEGSEQKPENIRKYLQLQGQLDGLVHSLTIKKVLEFLEENN